MTRSLPPFGATYAEAIRWKMKTSENSFGRPISIRELSKAVQRSYEQARKVYNGEPVVGSELNREICRVLNLDETAMLALAQREKSERKFRELGIPTTAAVPNELSNAWTRLSAAKRVLLQQVAASLAGEQDQDDAGAEREDEVLLSHAEGEDDSIAVRLTVSEIQLLLDAYAMFVEAAERREVDLLWSPQQIVGLYQKLHRHDRY